MTQDLPTRFRRSVWQVVADFEVERLNEWEQSQLTIPQIRVLFQLRRTPGIGVGDLSQALGVTVSTASGLVGKLADRGLVFREAVAEDRRQVSLKLSEQGARLAGEIAGTWRPFLVDVAAELGERLPEITTALEQLAATTRAVRLSQEEADSAGAR